MIDKKIYTNIYEKYINLDELYNGIYPYNIYYIIYNNINNNIHDNNNYLKIFDNVKDKDIYLFDNDIQKDIHDKYIDNYYN